MALDQPVVVVERDSRTDRTTYVLGVHAGAHPQELLLQGPEETLDAAVPLGGAHEGRARLDAEEGDLGLTVVADELAAVIVPQEQVQGDAWREAPELLPRGRSPRRP